jgi:DNA-binding response OmpR family regulator
MKNPPRQHLTIHEVRLLKELSRFPGSVVEWPVLADAVGVEANRTGNIRVASLVGNIRKKFGKDAILNANRKGYYLPTAKSKIDSEHST